MTLLVSLMEPRAESVGVRGRTVDCRWLELSMTTSEFCRVLASLKEVPRCTSAPNWPSTTSMMLCGWRVIIARLALAGAPGCDDKLKELPVGVEIAKAGPGGFKISTAVS